MSTEVSPERKRGGCLTAFLITTLVVSPLYVIVALLPMSAEAQQSLPNWPQWAIYMLGLVGLALFVCAFAIWKWKRWGVYGFAAATVVFLASSVLQGKLSIVAALFGLGIVMAILVSLVRPVWQKMG